MLLEGKVAIITGAGSARGIGRATARLFAEHGARLALLDLRGAQDVAAELGDQHCGYTCDVTDQAQVRATFAQIEADLGPAEVLVNNAGISQPKRIDEISEQDYDAVMDVSMRGTFLCSQAALAGMRKLGRGSIVNLSSVSAKRGGGIFGGPHYSAAKAGILGLTRALARDLGREQIRVNAVAPGLVDTDITQGQVVGERLEAVLRDIPLGRIAQPIDVARACLFLASDLAGYITGEVMDVNGGSHID
jgi:NAD(P)-dependent dehydrogenase (short-subunit alcohol dehydrogenase family)